MPSNLAERILNGERVVSELLTASNSLPSSKTNSDLLSSLSTRNINIMDSSTADVISQPDTVYADPPTRGPGFFGPLFLDSLIFSSDCFIGLSFVFFALNLRKNKTAQSVSLQTLGALILVRILHTFSHTIGLHFTPTFLPTFLFNGIDVLNSIAGIAAIYSFVKVYESYEADKDNFGYLLLERFGVQGAPARFSLLYIASALIALVWFSMRRGGNGMSYSMNYFCCFYEVVGSVALLPQLWMFHHNKRVSRLLGDFVMTIAANRICTLMFWICYPYVHDRFPDNRGVQMVSEVLNILILSDFLYYYVKHKIHNPTAEFIPMQDLAV